MFSKRFLSGAALTALSMSIGGVAHAQSTASQIQDEEAIVVTGRRSAEGTMIAEQAPKARSTITSEYIETQGPGQTILNTLNLVPGVNFTNNDAFGSSGGNLRLRGFDGNRVLLSFDGVPLNDTGNYAIYSNQQVDPELISRATVNLGTTDVDSPTAAVTGGTINYVTRLPGDEMGLMLNPSVGSEGYRRIFLLGDSGAFGPWGTRAFASFSQQNYDQWVGPGELEKFQYNARLYQPLAGDDFLSLSAHWNQNRNNFYRTGNESAWAGAGGMLSNITTCVRDDATAGVADNDGSGSSSNNAQPASCTNFYGLRINPSNTGNIRGQSRFSFGDDITFTFDPTVQYVLANGGGTSTISETDNRLAAGVVGVANSDSVNPACAVFDGTAAGVDLNGDCDTRDTVRLYSPSNTNTLRYTINTSLIWDINETNRVIFGYTYDTGRHRQTGEYSLLDANGNPASVWGGKDDVGGDPILTLAGRVFQKRDRLSIASLSQPSIRYIGDFFDDSLTVDVGLRAPTFTRDLDQRCFAPGNGSTSDPSCGYNPGGTVIAPFKAQVQYDEVLPNVGLTWRPAEGHQIYVSYAETLSAPRTDDLYSGIAPAALQNTVVPETAQSYDIGYRFQGGPFLVSAGAFFTSFENRIVRSYDPDLDITTARNLGPVDLWGAEAQVGWQATEALTLYAATAYNDSEVQDNLLLSRGPDLIAGTADDVFALTAGKQVVETPDWTFTARGEYEIGPLTLGAQARYVGERWRTDVNDLASDAYTVADIDVTWNVLDNTSLRLNVTNIFGEEYQGSLSTGTSGAQNYMMGAPRTMLLTLNTQF